MLRPALLILLGAVCVDAGATTCMEVPELEKQRRFKALFESSDVVALVGPQLSGARVLEVWKGTPGRTVYFRGAHKLMMATPIFALRPEPNGPLIASVPDPYSCVLTTVEARQFLEANYGAGYAPSPTRVESPNSMYSASWYAGVQFLSLALLSAIVWWFTTGSMRQRAPTRLQAAALPRRAPWRSVR